MSAIPWYVESQPVPSQRPVLRLVTDRPDEADDVLPLSVAEVAQPRVTVRSDRADAVTWRLTQRGVALALAGLGTLVASATGTLIWGFLQVPNLPLA
ncbi:MAG: hypothetical protein LBL92_07485 [Propionibacteriaceae bacterium]|nr:hypothetical protein [Propionibacteriaceae bacterium]